MIDSIILISGLILFTGTVTYDMNQKLTDTQKADTVTTEKAIFNQDIKHK